MEPTALLRNCHKRRNNLQKLIRDPPAVRKPQEPGYELPIEGELNQKLGTETYATKRRKSNGITNVHNWIT